MIDNFSIALTHGLLLLAFWRLITRPDLDEEAPPEPDREPAGFAAGNKAVTGRSRRDA